MGSAAARLSVFPGPQVCSEVLLLGLRPRRPSLLFFHLRLLPWAVRLVYSPVQTPLLDLPILPLTLVGCLQGT